MMIGFSGLGPMVDTVPCMFCAKPTRMTATKQCDACWELCGRMRGVPPTVLRRITKHLAEEGKTQAKPFVDRAARRLSDGTEKGNVGLGDEE
jgi:hypothetical protein